MVSSIGINSPQTAAKHQHRECQRSEFIIDVVFKGTLMECFCPSKQQKKGFRRIFKLLCVTDYSLMWFEWDGVVQFMLVHLFSLSAHVKVGN